MQQAQAQSLRQGTLNQKHDPWIAAGRWLEKVFIKPFSNHLALQKSLNFEFIILIMNVLSLRLLNQYISHPALNSVKDLVKWMGAVQAQDYAGALWGLGLRLKNNRELDIESAIQNKQIVRSWPMRGTLHFVAADDLRWMLQLLAPRVIKRAASIYRQVELDDKVFIRAKKIITAALSDGNNLTRRELYAILERSKISCEGQRGLHILGYLAQKGLICFGPRNGKQQTFVLLEEWLPPVKTPTQDEALKKLAITYFRSHGPATINDFAWWSGLSLTEVKTAIQYASADVIEEKINGQAYWMTPPSKIPTASPGVFLLPPFDEYMVAYKNRSLAIDPKFADKVKASGNGIFTAPIVTHGVMSGVWKRSFVKDGILIQLNPFAPMSKSATAGIATAGRKLGKFFGMPVTLETD